MSLLIFIICLVLLLPSLHKKPYVDPDVANRANEKIKEISQKTYELRYRQNPGAMYQISCIRYAMYRRVFLQRYVECINEKNVDFQKLLSKFESEYVRPRANKSCMYYCIYQIRRMNPCDVMEKVMQESDYRELPECDSKNPFEFSYLSKFVTQKEIYSCLYADEIINEVTNGKYSFFARRPFDNLYAKSGSSSYSIGEYDNIKFECSYYANEVVSDAGYYKYPGRNIDSGRLQVHYINPKYVTWYYPNIMRIDDLRDEDIYTL